jgi:hypothetical protein
MQNKLPQFTQESRTTHKLQNTFSALIKFNKKHT